MKKYELTKESIKVGSSTLYRIKALKSFGDVQIGDLGGFIESEKNLSQDGNAWVFSNAWVLGNAWVFSNAWVLGNARVYGNAWVYGDAKVYGNALVYGYARVYGDAKVYGNALVYGDAQVYGDALVSKFHQSCSITNLNWSFTSLPKGVQVGCHFHSMKEWKERYLEIGLKNGLTEEEAKAYYQLMKAIRKVQHIAGKRAK